MKSAILVLTIILAGTALPRIAGAATPIGVQPDFPIPMCGLPNGVLILCAWYNELADGGEVAPPGPPKTYAALTASMIGTTPTTITTNFPALISSIFANNPYINIQVANTPPAILALLSHSYYVHTKGAMSPLLTAAAKRLSAVNLFAFATVFSPAVFAPYVNSYTPATVKAQYLAMVAKTPPKPVALSQWAYDNAGETAYTMNGLSTGSPPSGMTVHSAAAQRYYAAQARAVGVSPDAGYVPSPLPSMAISDIWLEFYCAGVGTTYLEATIMASAYSAPFIGLAWWAGYKLGTGIYNWTESVSPGYFEDMIEYMGDLWQEAMTPTGTITIGEPISTTFPDGSTIIYDNFDICGANDVC